MPWLTDVVAVETVDVSLNLKYFLEKPIELCDQMCTIIKPTVNYLLNIAEKPIFLDKKYF